MNLRYGILVLCIILTVRSGFSQKKVLHLDFCEFTATGDAAFYDSLENFKVKKGEFFAIEIENINPYLYDIKITANNDTFKTGNVPPLFNAFMEISSLGTIAANVPALFGASSTAPGSENIAEATAIENILKNKSTIENKFQSSLDLIVESNNDLLEIAEMSSSLIQDTAAISTKKDSCQRLLDRLKSLSEGQIRKLNVLIDSLQETIKRDRNIIKMLNDQMELYKQRVNIRNLAWRIDSIYNEIIHCYASSYLTVYSKRIDCNGILNVDCYVLDSCECLTNDIKTGIDSITKYRFELLTELNYPQPGTKTSSSGSIKKDGKTGTATAAGKDPEPGNPEPEKVYAKLIAVLESNKYAITYLNKIYTKAYSNFYLSDHMESLSRYYSYPIQAQQDMIEIRIDITPRGGSSSSQDTSKGKDGGNTNTNTNTLSNQSPVSININPSEKPAQPKPDAKDGKTEKKPDEAAGKSEPAKPSDLLTDDELKMSPVSPVRQYHLNYKFRTRNSWWAYSAGFFINWLRDDNYTSFAISPNVSGSKYRVEKEDPSNSCKFGVMASVNAGSYFDLKSDYFYHFFAGPGLSIETKLQPQLFFGVGLGNGFPNKFSLNTGVVIGQVKRLSKSINTDAEYDQPQSISYYYKNVAGLFFSVNYTFGL